MNERIVVAVRVLKSITELRAAPDPLDVDLLRAWFPLLTCADRDADEIARDVIQLELERRGYRKGLGREKATSAAPSEAAFEPPASA